VRLIDAHNHLHDARLAPFRGEVIAELERGGIAAAVVNGTREEDWAAVAELARERAWVRPAFGLHPWYVSGRSPHWRGKLAELLAEFPQASLGEIGLDRWKEGYDMQAQMEVFGAQWQLAVEQERAATVHCLKAWGALWDFVRESPPLPRGFLLHSYGGAGEMVGGFVKQGAYFSFSGYFLHERRGAQREVFREVPLERLLVETDAPDMLPPAGPGVRLLENGTLNSPTNLEFCDRALAELRGMPVEELAEQIGENFARLFGEAEIEKRV
jgi:TatD DNase family protein